MYDIVKYHKLILENTQKNKKVNHNGNKTYS